VGLTGGRAGGGELDAVRTFSGSGTREGLRPRLLLSGFGGARGCVVGGGEGGDANAGRTGSNSNVVSVPLDVGFARKSTRAALCGS
jgi:hypothetical protein